MGEFHYMTADAGPAVTFLFQWTATPGRFFSGTEALRASRPGLLLRELDYPAIDTPPTGRRLPDTRPPR